MSGILLHLLCFFVHAQRPDLVRCVTCNTVGGACPCVQGMEGRFDLVVCLLGTFSHMLDNKQAAAAFRQVAKHLRPGGLFVLELAHPGEQARRVVHAACSLPCLYSQGGKCRSRAYTCASRNHGLRGSVGCHHAPVER